jgi:hypothetical protein
MGCAPQHDAAVAMAVRIRRLCDRLATFSADTQRPCAGRRCGLGDGGAERFATLVAALRLSTSPLPARKCRHHRVRDPLDLRSSLERRGQLQLGWLTSARCPSLSEEVDFSVEFLA